MQTASVPLPGWVKEIRPHQVQAVNEIVEAFQSVPVVYFDAPTGTGKTLVAELVRREMGLKTLYVCSTKSLMDQFGRDFDYAKMLKGRVNYPTELYADRTADDCMGQDCYWCESEQSCPYQDAKLDALRAPLACTNTSFLLSEANYVGKFSGRPLIVADEADTLESMLMGFVEYQLSAGRIKQFGMQEPGKGIHKPKLVAWLCEFAGQVKRKHQGEQDPKRKQQLRRLYQETERVIGELNDEIGKAREGESEGKWIRTYNSRDGGLYLKPVMVDTYGTRKLWRHGRKWLLMSATIISSDEMSESLGLPLDYYTVSVPMMFPVENRQVIMAPVANVVFKEMDTAVPQLVYAIGRVLEKHPHDRVLVHTVSYSLAKRLYKGLEDAGYAGAGTGRTLVSYSEGATKEAALKRYKETTGAVMLAPSMSRGTDLPGDLCRVQVVAKVPFLSTGDTQVSRRMYLPGGRRWYAVQAIRDIVQMTGRAVRSQDDWAVTYIFDRQFSSNLWREWKSMFPAWWRESVNTKTNIREYME